jgi:hypothetical protein
MDGRPSSRRRSRTRHVVLRNGDRREPLPAGLLAPRQARHAARQIRHDPHRRAARAALRRGLGIRPREHRDPRRVGAGRFTAGATRHQLLRARRTGDLAEGSHVAADLELGAALLALDHHGLPVTPSRPVRVTVPAAHRLTPKGRRPSWRSLAVGDESSAPFSRTPRPSP